MFSAAIPPQVTCSVLKALELIKTQPCIREKLWNNVNFLRNGLLDSNFDIGTSVSPIFPLMIRDNEKVYRIADLLQKKRIFASGIVYPAVRTKEARIRISVLASHEITQLKTSYSQPGRDKKRNTFLITLRVWSTTVKECVQGAQKPL